MKESRSILTGVKSLSITKDACLENAPALPQAPLVFLTEHVVTVSCLSVTEQSGTMGTDVVPVAGSQINPVRSMNL